MNKELVTLKNGNEIFQNKAKIAKIPKKLPNTQNTSFVCRADVYADNDKLQSEQNFQKLDKYKPTSSRIEKSLGSTNARATNRKIINTKGYYVSQFIDHSSVIPLEKSQVRSSRKLDLNNHLNSSGNFFSNKQLDNLIQTLIFSHQSPNTNYSKVEILMIPKNQIYIKLLMEAPKTIAIQRKVVIWVWNHK